MNERQKKIFWTFLGLLLTSQCVSVIVSFPASSDALRVWVSPRLVLGSKAQLRAVIVNQSDLAHRAGVRYRITLHQDKREQPLIEKTVDGRVLDFGFLVPRWKAGPARLVVHAQVESLSQRVAVPIELIEAPELGVTWSEPWRAYAAQSPADPAERETPRAQALPVQAFPVTGWAVRNIELPLILKRRSGSALRVRPEGAGQLGTVFDHEGFAQITMGQPLHRGRYRVEIADAAGSWSAHDLWLHNPPSELQITASKRALRPGEKTTLRLRSDNRKSSYTLQLYRGGQWEGMHEVAMSGGEGTWDYTAPQTPGWVSIVWASDLVTDSRRKAFITLRVGDAPFPVGLTGALSQPTGTNATLARLSRVHPNRLQPTLRADTTALRKSQVEEERRIRQGYAAMVFQGISVAFMSWLCLNILALYISRKRSRRALALEMEEAEVLTGHEFQTLGTILVLLGLLCLLLVIGYLFNHMVWGW